MCAFGFVAVFFCIFAVGALAFVVNRQRIQLRHFKHALLGLDHIDYQLHKRLRDVERRVPSQATSVQFYVNEDGLLKRKSKMNLKDSQKLPVSVKFTDAKGFDAPAFNIKWGSTDESVMTVTPSDDGKSAVVMPVGLGTAKVHLTATQGEDAASTAIIGELEVTVVGGDAINAVLVAGDAVDA